MLGLLSTKFVEVESADLLKQRIDEAAQFHPKENLGLATQCGFASASETAEQRLTSEAAQADKLKRIADVAREVWG